MQEKMQKRTDKILTYCYLVFGAFTLICFGSYFIKQIFISEGMIPLILTTAAIIAVTVPFLFRKQLRKALKKCYIPLKGVMCFGLMFFTVTFIGLAVYIYSVPIADAGNENDAVYVVFGTKVNEDGNPSSTLQARLDTAYDALCRDESGIAIVTGGKGDIEPIPEAESMCTYLIKKGISYDRIITEKEARNTIENILYSAEIVENYNLESRTIICVSSDIHIPRIRLLSNNMEAYSKYDVKYIKAPTPRKELIPMTLVREYLSYCKMIIIF